MASRSTRLMCRKNGRPMSASAASGARHCSSPPPSRFTQFNCASRERIPRSNIKVTLITSCEFPVSKFFSAVDEGCRYWMYRMNMNNGSFESSGVHDEIAILLDGISVEVTSEHNSLNSIRCHLEML